MYGKGLYDVLTQDEFITLCDKLKNNKDTIGLLKVLRHQFDISLHAAKKETENIFDGVDINEVYKKLCKGVLRKPDKDEFIKVCQNLRENGVMGTLRRLIAEYCNVNDETLSTLESSDFSSLQLRNKDELTYPFLYED